LSERRICRVLGQHRSTQRLVPRGPDDEERLTADIDSQNKLFAMTIASSDSNQA
jgi:hypothetical protein